MESNQNHTRSCHRSPLTGLPSGKLLKISVTAANEAGESPASDVVIVTVP